MATKRILILANTKKPRVHSAMETLTPWLREHGELVGVVSVTEKMGEPVPDADLAIVLGGDGSLLSAARAVASKGIALLGVNMGKMGFLAEFTTDDLRTHICDALEGRIVPVDRMMLNVCVRSCPKHKFQSPVANDVAVISGPPFRMIDLRVFQDDLSIAQYVGDGVVIATPTGSTGYNMSVGGPILEPSLDAMAISPIAPHSLSLRPIVIAGDHHIRISAASVNVGSAVIVDGQVSTGLCDGDLVEVSRSPYCMRIVPNPARTFLDTLSNKLQWGQSPHHRNSQ